MHCVIPPCKIIIFENFCFVKQKRSCKNDTKNKKFRYQLTEYATEIERLTTNNEILQGELDRIGVKTLKLEVGSSTDDIIAEIEKKDKIIGDMRERIDELIHLPY